MQTILHTLPFLLEGALVTIYISVLGTIVGIPIGTLVLILRRSGIAVAEFFARTYVSYFRSVPLLVQLLLFYNFLPLAGIDMSATMASVLALGLISGAYVAEILRGVLGSISQGQIEAARTLGYDPVSIWRTILLPQVFRLALPALMNELTLMMKSSSLISVVGIAELARTSQNIVSTTFRPIEIYTATCAIYIVITQILLLAGRIFEHRMRRAGR
ncbi:ABC transporter permease subunit [Agrobacterium vitis]|uniref:ABC transporter permease subunit n=2 Tax=Agrobacterium vitis TaxID=373 RepID=A0ABD6GI41_AGRVI|nr:amino acid ABC transporter permease [Agrobacterium vitis]KAA3506248.1 amino acid ABC transporter permease [Agrobacterium vitis]MCF1480134.1 amino acid ABC transporter permease [Agrobacterium vitis]MUP07878.1 ABC transporter permease subunit [Agrobacterium vitis]MUZ99724.1 ABC transporter permease subunit [Agrobacterium vitis]MVA32424.1 ABC transporter permease subunit [Agrobacterium vitis]